MALIWADGLTADKALAPLWAQYAAATARANDPTLSEGDQAAALVQANKAQSRYKAAVAEATAALGQLATNGAARTHVFIIGVGGYDSGINAVSTSVHGARAFAEWMLTRFQMDARPLGSIELFTSPAPGQGEWTPPGDVAARLGFAPAAGPTTVPSDPATFAAINAAFEPWLQRAGTLADNAAMFYFAGHGVRKSEMFLLSQDAQLPSQTRAATGLIAIEQTLARMKNRQPKLQCVFLDACQEIPLDLLVNLDASVGTPLGGSLSAPQIPDVDSFICCGSYPGLKAYGPENQPPYFTQELLLCLEKRAGTATTSFRFVTSSSLRDAIQAAGSRRAQIENNADIRFTYMAPGANGPSRRLCQFRGPAEVILMIQCDPAKATAQAKLYTQVGEVRTSRPGQAAVSWYTTVPQAECVVGAEFDPATALKGAILTCSALPPFVQVDIEVSQP